MRKALIIAAAMLAAGAVVLVRRQREAANDDNNLDDEFGVMFNQATQETAELIDNLTGGSMRISAMAKVTAADVQHQNVQAFLRVIRRGEGTLDANGYRRIFGGQLFDSFADHPRVKVSKSGYVSTAAGAYQFLSSTWDETKRVMNLPDFSPASQDLGAVGRIAARGALDDVKAGRLETAIKKCAKEWASLPYSPYGQPTISMITAAGVFANAGGVVTA
jgi:muramidase (phage lysozyme)